MVSGPMSCVKYLLFVFNLLFAISGIAILVVGAISQTVYQNYSNFVDDKFYFIPIVLIVIGVVIFVIAFFGCCGAVKENHCMITTFATLLLLVFIVELAAGIAAYVFRNDIDEIVETKMLDTMKYYDTNGNIKNDWDILQHDVSCCGVRGKEDWQGKIPSTCCPNMSQEESCDADRAYSKGCWSTVQELFTRNAIILGGVALGVAFVQLVGVIFACCLARSIQKDYETV